MGKQLTTIDDQLRDFIHSQPVFFVATAPLDASGHVNLSPKGLDSLRVLGGDVVAYADLTGSGVETISHLKENGRIVFMFCAFEGPPKIVRLHGVGEVIEPDHPDFLELSEHFPAYDGLRSVIRVECTRISQSCGFGVPKMEFVAHRDQLIQSAAKKGPAGIKAYQQQKNRLSIDGLQGISDRPGLDDQSRLDDQTGLDEGTIRTS